MFWGSFPGSVSPSLSGTSFPLSIPPHSFSVFLPLCSLTVNPTSKAGRELGWFLLQPAFHDNVCRGVGCTTSSLKYLPCPLSVLHLLPEQRRGRGILSFLLLHTLPVWIAVSIQIELLLHLWFLAQVPLEIILLLWVQGRLEQLLRIHYNNIQQTKLANSCWRPPWHPILVPKFIFWEL